MKHLRLFVLVLLAVLLPIRGVVAATMSCPDGGGPGTAAVVADHAHHEMQADDGMDADHAADPAASGEHPANCHFCASGCCMASIVGTVPPLLQPSLMSSVAFPALTAPVPAFQSDGQDRPPRSI